MTNCKCRRGVVQCFFVWGFLVLGFLSLRKGNILWRSIGTPWQTGSVHTRNFTWLLIKLHFQLNLPRTTKTKRYLLLWMWPGSVLQFRVTKKSSVFWHQFSLRCNRERGRKAAFSPTFLLLFLIKLESQNYSRTLDFRKFTHSTVWRRSGTSMNIGPKQKIR